MTSLPPDTPRRALRQALWLALLVAAVALTWAWVAHQPDGPDELKIATAMVRSHSAELDLMREQADQQLPPSFVRTHAAQLAQSVSRTEDELAQLRPATPQLHTLADELQAHARQVEREVQALAQAPRSANAASANAGHARTEALATAELRLQR